MGPLSGLFDTGSMVDSSESRVTYIIVDYVNWFMRGIVRASFRSLIPLRKYNCDLDTIIASVLFENVDGQTPKAFIAARIDQ